jgi:alpha-tubulin suppressor-like RCC1 family protein
VHLPARTRVTAIAAGGNDSLALTSDDRVLAWGDNEFGQLGNGTTTNSTLPIPVDLPAGVHVTAIAAADRHSLALTSDGRVLAWGFNGAGQLGNHTITNSLVPVWTYLPPGTRVTAIAAGTDDFSLALAVPPPGNLPA